MEKFSYETNGYNRSEVNNFVSQVIKETEGIITKCKAQSVEIEKLRKEIEHYKNLENTMSTAISKAEVVGDNLRRLAKDESDMIIQDAKNNASKIVNEALIRADKIEKSAMLLENNMKVFKKKLRLIMEQQMAVVEEIEVLELDP